MSGDTTGRPGAPALEKGLDVLELLAGIPGGLTQKQIAERVGRSVSEIFRMLVVLEQRGFVSRAKPSGEYTLTLRLFHLATQHPPTQRLQQAAAAVLELLAAETNLSCHLTILTGSFFTVLAQTEPDWQMGWHVKLGARFPLSLRYPSARVLAAFHPDGPQQPLADAISKFDGVTLEAVMSNLETVRREGGVFDSEGIGSSLTSFSCPVLENSGHVLAAVTLPLMHDSLLGVDVHRVGEQLRDAAAQIAQRIGLSAG